MATSEKSNLNWVISINNRDTIVKAQLQVLRYMENGNMYSEFHLEELLLWYRGFKITNAREN